MINKNVILSAAKNLTAALVQREVPPQVAGGIVYPERFFGINASE